MPLHKHLGKSAGGGRFSARKTFLFVCVARFAPQKNHALLLKAFAQGPASDPKAHLVCWGGILQEGLEEQAKNLGLANRVPF